MGNGPSSGHVRATHLQTHTYLRGMPRKPAWSTVIPRLQHKESQGKGLLPGHGGFIRNAALGVFEPSNSEEGIRSLAKRPWITASEKKKRKKKSGESVCEIKALINANVSGGPLIPHEFGRGAVWNFTEKHFVGDSGLNGGQSAISKSRSRHGGTPANQSQWTFRIYPLAP